MVERFMQHGRRHLLLTILAILSAAVSIGSLLIYALGILPMYFTVNLVAAPSLVMLLVLGVLARCIDEKVFFNRLLVGAISGILATVAYDLIRLVLWKGGVFSYDPFLSHPIFGSFITELPETHTKAIVVGWAYHFWNGFAFGIMYTLIAGRAKWGYALLWALFLEVGWILALPSTLSFQLNSELIAISFIGHGAYGVVLGLLAQRYVRE